MMEVKRWLVLLVSLALVLLSSRVGVTRSSFVDLENSGDNSFEAWASTKWTQTTQAHFNAGVLSQVDTTSSSGDVKLTSTSSWYVENWSYRRQITIDHTEVNDVADPSTTYANFPVLVYATGLSNVKAGGADIRFTSSDGVTKLPREIESYSGGTLYAWVGVTLTKDASDSTDDVIYMYYGNDSASEPAPDSTYGSENVWNSNYRGVWHLVEGQSGTGGVDIYQDSTSNDNHGDDYVSATDKTGQIDGGQGFDGSNDEINFGNASSLQITTELTVQAWCKPTTTGVYRGIGGKIVASSGYEYRGYTLAKADNNRFRFLMASGGSSAATLESNSAYADTDWHFVVGVRRGGVNYLYIDGVQQTETNTQSIADSGSYAYVGRQYSDYSDRWWYGQIDEFRISNTGRSADWIQTEYNNQDNPSAFCGVGSEETEGLSYSSPGNLASQVLDTGVSGAVWNSLFWDETLPSNTNITFSVRASDTLFDKSDATPDWTDLGTADSPITSGLPSGRYLQWRATLTTSDTSHTPVLHEVRVYHY